MNEEEVIIIEDSEAEEEDPYKLVLNMKIAQLREGGEQWTALQKKKQVLSNIIRKLRKKQETAVPPYSKQLCRMIEDLNIKNEAIYERLLYLIRQIKLSPDTPFEGTYYNKYECIICLNDRIIGKNVVHTNCTHHMCVECFRRLSNYKCPVCRQDIYSAYTIMKKGERFGIENVPLQFTNN